MSPQAQNRHGIAARGLLALLLCATLLAAHGHTRTHDAHHVQRSALALTPILDSEWGGTARASRPDQRPDLGALAPPNGSIAADPLDGGHAPAATTVATGLRSVTLPGIRAPPRRAPSA